MRIVGIWSGDARIRSLVVSLDNLIKPMYILRVMESFMRFAVLSLGLLSATVLASSDMQPINGFLIDRTEVSIAKFQRYATETGFVSQAEKAGGGEVYGWGWEQKAGWTWKTPFGMKSNDQLPAVHLTYDAARDAAQEFVVIGILL